MDGQRSNYAFVPDGEKEGFPPTSESIEEFNQKEVFVVELNDLRKAKERHDKYDPYNHREVDHPTTNMETLLHLLKGSLGTGILAMPNAFYHSGYVVGSFGTLIIGLICTYCIHLLIKAEYEICKRKKVPSMTYPATAEAALLEGPECLRKFAPYSIHIVNTFLVTYQLGTCCVYVVFISTNVKSVADIYITNLDLEIYMLIFLLPLILINYIRNLKRLAPFSTVANGVTVVSFGIILYYIIQDHPTIEGKEMVGQLKHFPLYFGTVLFALEAIGVIMPLENEMKTPKSFGGKCGVLNFGMFVIISLYVGMGLLGYLAYGSAAQGSITLNIPKDQILAQVVKVMLALAIFISYGLQCYVAVDIAWNEYLGVKLEQNKRQLFWEYFTRTSLVLITFLLAVAVPKLDLFISLFGALCLSMLGLAFPATIDMLTHWHQRNGFQFVLLVVKNMFLIVFGLCGLIVGTYTSLHDIILEFSE